MALSEQHMTRRFVITGAASGIGRELSRRVLEAGDQLLAIDINAEPLAELNQYARPGQFYCERFDVSDPHHWQLLEQKIPEIWPRFDVMMNIAGVVRPGWVEDQLAMDVDHHIDINTKGVIYGTQMATRLMMDQEPAAEGSANQSKSRGHIVNVASLAGIAAVPGISLYTASKFAVRGYSLAVAQELRRHGIAVSVVCPDLVDTPMLDEEIEWEEETALVFSGGKVLSVGDVCDVLLGEVLSDQPLERCIPKARGRLAHFSSVAPKLSSKLADQLAKRGSSNKRKLRKQRQD